MTSDPFLQLIRQLDHEEGPTALLEPPSFTPPAAAAAALGWAACSGCTRGIAPGLEVYRGPLDSGAAFHAACLALELTRQTPTTWRSVMTCYHPEGERWLSTCGHVEVCGRCSETRRAEPDDVGRFWRPSNRQLTVVDGELLTLSADGRVLYRREPVRRSQEAADA